MVNAGAAVVIPDAELEPKRLYEVVRDLIWDRTRLQHMAGASRSLAKPDAAARIADEVLSAASS